MEACRQIPPIKEYLFMFAGAKPNNKTIFSVIKKEKEQPATGLIYIFLGYL